MNAFLIYKYEIARGYAHVKAVVENNRVVKFVVDRFSLNKRQTEYDQSSMEVDYKLTSEEEALVLERVYSRQAKPCSEELALLALRIDAATII